jgi:cardiolipin synthase
MSHVQVAIPMLRGTRHFYIQKGRRWSVVEHLMLDAVARRPATAITLSEKSCLPRRVVVEAFIRLMRVCWVELLATDTGSVFTATESGKAQLGSSDLPAATTREGRWMSFSTDLVAGNVFRRKEMYVHSRVTKAAESDALVYLNPSLRHSSEDLSAIFAALENENEVIVGVASAPEKLIGGYGLVSVIDGQIDGLPGRANEALRSAIMERALPAVPKSPGRRQSAVDPALRASPQAASEVDALFDQADLLLDAPDHRNILEKVLKKARELVVIHSTFISPDGWKGILPKMLEAAANGTTIQVFWGQTDDQKDMSSSRTQAALFRGAIAEAGRSDHIIVHPFPTDSHAKILLSDDGNGRWSAVVGSCNWLASEFDSYEASINLRDPKLVGEMLRHLAALAQAYDGVWNQTAMELTALGRRISSIKRGNGRTAKMRILLAPDHADLVLLARDKAQNRIVVTSHRLGVAGKPIVITPALAAARAKDIACSLYYGRATGPLSGLNAAALAAELNKTGVSVRPVHRPRLHAKVLAWDDHSIAVTSQNWLSADPSDTALRREIGIYIEQNRVADTFIRRFDLAKSKF